MACARGAPARTPAPAPARLPLRSCPCACAPVRMHVHARLHGRALEVKLGCFLHGLPPKIPEHIGFVQIHATPKHALWYNYVCDCSDTNTITLMLSAHC